MKIIIDDDGNMHKVITLAELDEIKAEINRQYKWLIKTSYTSDIDIAFRSIFRFIDEYKAESEDGK